MYHALVLNNIAVIRNADDGITDREFSLGVRMSPLGVYPSRLLLDNMLAKTLDVVPIEEWNEHMEEIDPRDSLPTDFFKNTYSPYDRAPWETNVFKEYY